MLEEYVVSFAKSKTHNSGAKNINLALQIVLSFLDDSHILRRMGMVDGGSETVERRQQLYFRVFNFPFILFLLFLILKKIFLG